MRENRQQSNRKRSRTENVKRIIAGSFLQQMTDQILPFITRTVMIYTLGSLYLGLNGLFTSILQVLNLAELGFGEAMVFSMYKPLAERDTAKICALLNLYRKVYRVIGLVIAAAGLACMPFLRSMISGEVPAEINIYVIYILTLANTCIGYLAFAYRQALFSADQRSDVLSLTNCLCRIIEFLIRMFVLVVLRNYYLYCLASPIVTLAGNLLVNRLSRKAYPEYICEGILPSSDVSQIKKKMSGLFINRFSYVCRNSFDSVTLSAFLGLTVVTIFQNYFFILRAVTKLTTLFSGSILSSVGNSIATESQEKNFSDFQKFQLLFMWMTGWCTVCLLCLYQPFMQLWMGEERMLSHAAVIVFCMYYFSDMMSNLCYVYRQAAGLYEYRRFVPVLQSAVNLTLNILLVNRFGVTGVLMSTIFCQVVIDAKWSAGILFDYYFTEQKQSAYLLRLAAYGLITAAACAVSWFICSMIRLTGLPLLVVRGGICIVVPNIVFALALRMLPEYREAVKFVKDKLIHRRKRSV